MDILKKLKGKSGKAFYFLIPVFVILCVVVLVKKRPGPEKNEVLERPRPVRVIEVKPMSFVPRAMGYGSVKPEKEWQAVAQVGGRVVEVSETLKAGSFCKKGTVLLRIDSAEYKLAVLRAEGNIAETRARLLENEARKINLSRSLDIEKQSLALSLKNMNRKKKLLRNSTISPFEYEKEVREYNGRLSVVQELKNSINLIEPARKQLLAAIGRYETDLENARRDLGFTEVTAPFDGRVFNVDIEKDQYAQKGQVLVSIDGTRRAEVTAQVPIDRFLGVVPQMPEAGRVSPFNLQNAFSSLGIKARVSISSGDFSASWNAGFLRAEASIDQRTRTVGVVVAVDGPYDDIRPGIRPPLVRGMFCRVELSGKTIPRAIVIPSSALHGSSVYIVGESGRLVRREVKTRRSHSGLLFVEKGLEGGEVLIVSDLVPAVEGMLLKPVADEILADNIQAAAEGTSSLN